MRQRSPFSSTSPARLDVVVERDEEGYCVASLPALQDRHTQAKSLDDLCHRIREAIRAVP
ncbi:MAG: type II toxin-antitoxin system HicB family antitoxin [Bryobacteraceae bacterium]